MTLLWILLLQVGRLGDDSWHERERAQATLQGAGLVARPILALGLHNRDPEIAKRCRAALDYPAVAVRERWKLEEFPFFDSLWYDPEAKRYELTPLWAPAAAWLRGFLLSTSCGYDGYRAATCEVTVTLHTWGVPLEAFEPVFRELRRRDRLFLGLPPDENR